MKTYSSEGIILYIKPHSEADKIVTVFTPNKGKLRLLAKGTRKPSSRKRGHLDSFNKIKFSAVTSNNFEIFSEVSVINSFESIKSDLKRTSVAYFLVEVINKLTVDNEPHEDVYLIINNYLDETTNSTNLKKLRYEFIKDILISLGFWPEGKVMINPDVVLSEVSERQMRSARVGKKILS